MHSSYDYVWVAIFGWGLGGTLLNFAMLVLLLTVLDGGCPAVRRPAQADLLPACVSAAAVEGEVARRVRDGGALRGRA